MRKLILSSLELVSHIAIFLILLSGLFQGATAGAVAGQLAGTIIGGLFGFFVALVFCVIVFGTLFLLMEIADNTRRTAAQVDALRVSQTDQ